MYKVKPQFLGLALMCLTTIGVNMESLSSCNLPNLRAIAVHMQKTETECKNLQDMVNKLEVVQANQTSLIDKQREQIAVLQEQLNKSKGVDGEWSGWSSWGTCSTTCDAGLRTRHRNCSNPRPSNGGDHCFGDSADYRTCSLMRCTEQTTGTNTTTSTCPEDWLNFTSSCYFFSQDNSDVFSDAQAMCKKEGAHLAYVDNADENNFIKQHIINNGLQGRFWIGLSDQDHEGVWKYYGTEIVATFFDWHSGEPSDNSGFENCVELYDALNYDWNDLSCSFGIYYICEKETEM